MVKGTDIKKCGNVMFVVEIADSHVWNRHMNQMFF